MICGSGVSRARWRGSVTELGSEDGRLPEQLQSEAQAGAHGTKAVVVALLANLMGVDRLVRWDRLISEPSAVSTGQPWALELYV